MAVDQHVHVLERVLVRELVPACGGPQVWVAIREVGPDRPALDGGCRLCHARNFRVVHGTGGSQRHAGRSVLAHGRAGFWRRIAMVINYSNYVFDFEQ